MEQSGVEPDGDGCKVLCRRTCLPLEEPPRLAALLVSGCYHASYYAPRVRISQEHNLLTYSISSGIVREMANTPDAEERETARRQRSPQHPAFSLKDAIEKARLLYEKVGNTKVSAFVVVSYWGYSEKSSSGLRAIATMADFGLVSVDGTGDAKRIGISDLGRILVRHPDSQSEEYRDALVKAAMSPKIHRDLREHFSSGLPNDDGALAWELEQKFEFQPSAIPAFMAQLRETFGLVMPAFGDKVGEKRGNGHEKPPLDPPKPRPGMKQEVFSLAGGDVVLQWPAQMTADEYEDFKGWLRLIERKAGRAVQSHDPEDDSEA